MDCRQDRRHLRSMLWQHQSFFSCLRGLRSSSVSTQGITFIGKLAGTTAGHYQSPAAVSLFSGWIQFWS
jgi:hypothetical protein